MSAIEEELFYGFQRRGPQGRRVLLEAVMTRCLTLYRRLRA